MATATTLERRQRYVEVEDEAASPLPKRQRRSWRLLAAPAIVAAVVWFLPAIIAHSPLLGWIIGRAAGDLNGSVAIQSASLGWLSPINAQGVEVCDAEGKPVLSATEVAGDRSLAALLMNHSNLGHFRLEKPKLALVLRDDGSNLEDVLAKYLAPKEEPSSEVGLSLEIVDGSVSITDQNTGQTWQIEKLAVSLDVPSGGESIALKAAADLPDARRPGKLNVALSKSSGAGEAKLSAAEVPLAMFRALAARFVPKTTLTGRLSSEATASWGNDTAAKNIIQADLNAEEFSFSTPALQGDVVRLETLRGSCRATLQGDRLNIDKSSFDCDLGNVAFSGTAPLGQQGGLSLDALARQRQEISGRVDLARLARLLPATLHLRQEMQINSGQVQWMLSSKPNPQGPVWHGQLDAANLTAVRQGKQLAWERPVSVVLDAHQTAQGPVVDGLKCESDFLKLHANGTPENLTASASFNLKQLADQLGQFVDFGGVQLAGEGWGSFNWKRTEQRQFTADGEVQIQKFQLATPNQQPWNEESLLLFCTAKGRTDFGADTQLDSAALNVKAGADKLDVQLTQPVTDLRNGGVWPVSVQMQGQLQNWPARLGAWLPTKDWQMAGGYKLDVLGTGSKDGLELRTCTLAVAPLTLLSPSLILNEPRLDAALVGSWSQRQRRLQLEPANLACATFAVQANNVVVAVPVQGPVEMAGTLKYSGLLERLRQCFADPKKASTWQLTGQLSGAAQVTQSGGKIHGETAADVANLTVVDSSGGKFQEPRIHLTALGGYDHQTGTIQLEKCELTSSVLSAGVAGQVASADGRQTAELGGQIGYDLDRLAGMLRPYIGPGVRIVGRGASPAWYRGPFSLAAGQANAGLKWDRANVYGFQVGPGELKAAMSKGVVQVEPMDLAVSQGRMHLAPSVRLTPEPIELTMPAGPLAQKIQIDPIMCGWFLKYIAPVLAEVTSAQGTFSIELDGCRIPLSDPAKGDLAGRFIVHSVEIGPGPLIRELAVFMGRETPARLRQEAVVPFRMVQGRVYHKDLELLFPDFTIRTYGSVGFDQTLAVMTEMPVPPKWLENNPAAPALRNQTIRVPLAGTLSKPELDKKVMGDLTEQFLRRAAVNLLEDGLNQLFRPKN